MTRADIALELQRVSPDELTVAADLPQLAQKAAGKSLAPRPAAEDYDAAAQKTRCPAASSIVGLAPQPGAVEQDRLGRQEFQSGAGADRQGLARSRSVAPVER